ncbi:MAG: thiamine pyrophosphate-dependent dehydrogenase E1 component subunit alpha [Candidatus Aminicenantia bacterium]
MDKELATKLLKTMHLIRSFEEKIEEAYWNFEFTGELHLSNGQEAVATGVMLNLKENDAVETTHRAHGHLIAKGVDLKKMTAEIYGKVTGFSKGKGGHMHLIDPSKHISTSGIVGASLPIALGYAFAFKYRKAPYIAVAMFGEGAQNEGAFHESLNLAKVLKLPVLFVCEDNKYAISTVSSSVTASENSVARAATYGIPGKVVDGNDVVAVYESSKEAVEYVRSGKGPYLLEFKTYRLSYHLCGDIENYKPEGENEEMLKQEPLSHFKTYLLRENFLSEKDIRKIENWAQNKVKEAIEYARKSPYPNLEEAYTDVFIK